AEAERGARGERRGMAWADEPGVAGRAARGELPVALDDANRGAGAGELERAAEADRPGADDDDVRRAHAENVKSGPPSASTSTSTPSPGPGGAAPRPPVERG